MGSTDDQVVERSRELAASGDYAQSLAVVARALSAHPGEPRLLLNRACTLFDWGRFREAYDAFHAARAAGHAGYPLELNLALTCHQLARFGEAEVHAQEAARRDPASEHAHFGLATVLQARRRYEDAIASFRRVLEVSPKSAGAIVGIAACELAAGAFENAERAARQAIEIDGGDASVWNTLAIALFEQGRHDDSLDAHMHALARDEQVGISAETFANYGASLLECGRAREACDLFERYLPSFCHPLSQAHYGFALLTLGELERGFAQYEFRWFQDPLRSARPGYPIPTWSGQSLADKTILLWAEQGVGDVIQFARYAACFKRMGATVLLQVHPAMDRIGAWFANVDRAFSKGESFTTFDYHLPLMSVPHALGTGIDSIPREVPYVQCARVYIEKWKERLEAIDRIKVGIVWAGNPSHRRDRHRSIPARTLAPLWQVKGIHFVSLQKEMPARDRDEWRRRDNVTELDSDLADFADTAAVIAQLDLVICVDTAVAHLAGALGKPVWLLLPQHGDFRWLQDREDSPWYPTMRLFRQQRMGDWEEVIQRVAGELSRFRFEGAQPSVAVTCQTLPGKDSTALLLTAIAESRHGIFEYWPDDEPVASMLRSYGEYMEAALDVVRSLTSAGGHILEVGAGIGAHTVPLARHVGESGHVIAYESEPRLRRVLRQNLEANRVAATTTVMRGSLRGLGIPKAMPQEAGSPAHTIDELLLERIDVIKVNEREDAAAVLESAHDTLWRLRPTVVALVGEAPLNLIAGAAAARGYRCWIVTVPAVSTENFNRRAANDAGKRVQVLVGTPEESDWQPELADARELSLASMSTGDAVTSKPSSATDTGSPRQSILARALSGVLSRRG